MVKTTKKVSSCNDTKNQALREFEERQQKYKMLAELVYGWVWRNAPRFKGSKPGVDVYENMLFVMWELFSKMSDTLKENYPETDDLDKEIKRTKKVLRNCIGRI